MIRALAIASCLLANSVAAQEVVGTSVIGGKRVELLSDKSWRYQKAPSASENCVPINNVLEFCGSILDWRPSSTIGTDFLRIFRHDDRAYAGIIYENFGRDADISIDTMRQVVLENAAAAAYVTVEEIPVLSIDQTEVDGIFGEKITYGANVSGLNVVYQNALLVSRTHSMQFLVWTIGKDISDEDIALFDAFIGSIGLDLPENDI